MSEIKKVFEVWTTVDDRGGRGRMVGVFTQETTAREERIKREALAKLSPRERRLLKVQE